VGGALSPDPAVVERFDRIMAAYDTTMLLVTTVNDTGERSGCLVGFATQCSIDPRRFLVGLSVANHTYRTALDAEVLAVHLVPADRRDLATWFGSTTGDEVDTFAEVAWRPGIGGVPLVEGCPEWFAGRIIDRLPMGDHVGFILDPVDASGAGAGPPVTHLRDVSDLTPGHEA
jgi:flavin reductase (DIM6/NTAB) family NADH-FMN oxidoreductase RutF